jgi:PAS domain S-box/diguanylate cyclase (GGDEF) domain
LLLEERFLVLTGVALAALLAALVVVRFVRSGRLTLGRSAGYAWCRAAVEQSVTGVLLADLVSLRVLDANPAMQRATGLSLAELRRLTLEQIFVDEKDGESIGPKLRQADPRVPLRVRQRCRGGELVDTELSVNRLAIGARNALVVVAHDISVRRRIEAQLLENQQRLDHLAHHDQLTGLPNRHYLAAHLPGAIEEARRNGAMLAVLFLDLDRFKHINDSRGHETGDKLLQNVAARIRSIVREGDMVVRMGGDEFIVVLRNVRNPAQISETASRINEALAQPVIVDGRPLLTTASIGIALFPRDGTDMGELLKHSDTAMYQAKDRGRNNFQLFSPILDRRLKERIALETSLRAALQSRQLDVRYQPIIDIETRKVVALEALLRWQHPAQGAIPPSRFIAVAEETGLIVPIGEFVLERVMQDAARWRAGGAKLVPIAVNVSAVQLLRSDLRRTILKLSAQHRIEPEMLQLELTESAVFESREARYGESSEDAIARLREIGVAIAIDDFGTGYSSLSYLKRWRVDSLKIDRTFVRDVVTDLSDLAIVGAIVAMARHLHIAVVAEGIEGFQQLEKLRQLGCGFAQGNLFARPAPASACGRFLTGEPLAFAHDSEPLDRLEATGTSL